MLASGVFAGIHDEQWAYVREDAKGKKFGEKLERIGWKGDEKVGARKIHALFELHIQQGPILEAEGKDIGVVTHGQGLWWLQITLTGKESHTGSTPMPMRKNAGLGVARITELVHAVAMAHQPNAVGAIGHVDVYPEFPQCQFRAKSCSRLISARQTFRRFPQSKAEIEAKAPEIANELGLGIEIEEAGHFDSVTFNEGCVTAVRDVLLERLGYSHRDLVSGRRT